MAKRRRKMGRPGFRPVDAPQLSITRNLDKKPGDRVRSEDIIAFALALHPPCRGKGFTVKYRVYDTLDDVPAGTPDNDIDDASDGRVRVRIGELCKCAQRRFSRAHPEVIVDAAGILWWPAQKGLVEG